MTSPYGPPGYPPYGSPPPAGGPARSSSTVSALLAALFVVATVLAAIVVHAQDAPATSSAGAVPNGSFPSSGSSGGIPAGNSASYAIPTPSAVSTYPTLPTTSYVPPPTPSPTRIPLDPQLVDRTFALYMNGLANRSLSQVKSVTCPRLRSKTIGTALNRKYISRWRSAAYTIPYYQDYIIVSVTVRYVNPNTGGDGGLGKYRFYVSRYPDGNYWVCGYL